MTDQKDLEQLDELLKSSGQRLNEHVSAVLAKPAIKEAVRRDQRAEAEAAAAEAAATRKYA